MTTVNFCSRRSSYVRPPFASTANSFSSSQFRGACADRSPSTPRCRCRYRDSITNLRNCFEYRPVAQRITWCHDTRAGGLNEVLPMESGSTCESYGCRQQRLDIAAVNNRQITVQPMPMTTTLLKYGAHCIINRSSTGSGMFSVRRVILSGGEDGERRRTPLYRLAVRCAPSSGQPG